MTRSVSLVICLIYVLTSISALLATEPSLVATTHVPHWQPGSQRSWGPGWRRQPFSVILCFDTWRVAPEPRRMTRWLTTTQNARSLTFLFLPPSRCFTSPISHLAFSFSICLFNFSFMQRCHRKLVILIRGENSSQTPWCTRIPFDDDTRLAYKVLLYHIITRCGTVCSD